VTFCARRAAGLCSRDYKGEFRIQFRRVEGSAVQPVSLAMVTQQFQSANRGVAFGMNLRAGGEN
jgi:hypothetical protein